MVRHTKPVIPGKPAPSLSVIQGIWYRLITMLTFRHRDLKDNYGAHDVKRIEVHLDQLVKRKLLVKGRWFKKQWFGFRIVEKLANTWIEKSLVDGCLSWDTVLLKLLSVLLMAGLAARCGDITRSALYQGTEFLTFRDVEITLSSQLGDKAPSVQDLRGKFTLKYTKGKK